MGLEITISFHLIERFLIAADDKWIEQPGAVLYSETTYRKWGEQLIVELRGLGIEMPTVYQINQRQAHFHVPICWWGELKFTIPGGSTDFPMNKNQEIVANFFKRMIVFTQGRKHYFRFRPNPSLGTVENMEIIRQHVVECWFTELE